MDGDVLIFIAWVEMMIWLADLASYRENIVYRPL